MIEEIDILFSPSGRWLVFADNVEIARFDTSNEALQLVRDVAA